MAKREKSEFDVVKSYKRLFFLLTYTVPPIYILMLLMLQIKESLPHNEEYYFFLLTTDMNIIILLLGLASLLIVPLTYKFLIPYIKKLNDDSRVPLLLMNLNNSGLIISTFGLIIGIIGYAKYNVVDWFTILPFLAIGISYSIYVKIKIIPPIFKRYEMLSN
ncbi:MAG: hypothetical protein ACFFA3_18540 [Promethearchaeota archaeon]